MKIGITRLLKNNRKKICVKAISIGVSFFYFLKKFICNYYLYFKKELINMY